jgi:hypothetical protein
VVEQLVKTLSGTERYQNHIKTSISSPSNPPVSPTITRQHSTPNLNQIKPQNLSTIIVLFLVRVLLFCLYLGVQWFCDCSLSGTVGAACSFGSRSDTKKIYSKDPVQALAAWLRKTN